MIKKKKNWSLYTAPYAPTKITKPDKTLKYRANKTLATIDISDIIEEFNAIEFDKFKEKYLNHISKEIDRFKADNHKELKVYFNCKPQTDYYGGYCGFEKAELVIIEVVEKTEKNKYYDDQLKIYNKALETYPAELAEYKKECEQWAKWKAQVEENDVKIKLKRAQKILEDNGFEVKKGNKDV